MRRTGTSLIALATALGGCGHELAVARLDTANPQPGVIYVLPFTQYTVTMTWRVADCSGPEPKVALKVDAVSGTADDGQQAYVIDPTSLQGIASIKTFEARYQDGSNALASINASAEDRSGAIVGNIVTTIAKLAPLAFGVPRIPGRPPPVNTPPPPPPVCTPAVTTALAASRAAKAQVDDLTDQITATTAEIARLGAKAVTMGAALDEATKKSLSEAIDHLADLQQRQGVAADTLAAALKVITSVRTEAWPQDSSAVAGGPFGVEPSVLSRWFTGVTNFQPPQVALSLERVGSFGQDPSKGALALSRPVENRPGIRYRIPARGRLVACTTAAPGAPPSASCSSSNADVVLTKVEGPVAQLGYVGTYNVRNRAFGSTTFAGTFTPLMGPASVSYEQKTAPAEGATAALANAAGTLAPVFDPTARVNADTAYLKAIKDRRDAAAALQPAADDPNGAAKAALDSDTSLLAAQAANAQAKITLAELTAKLPN